MSRPPDTSDTRQSQPHHEASAVHVCSLLSVHDVLEATRARFLVTVINEQMMLATPHRLDTDNHLRIACNDISQEMPGLTPPSAPHVDGLIRFAHRWNRQGPLVIHCWAGISRSTAAAFVTLCALNPQAPELDIANHLRAASPTAAPNRLIVRLADAALGRGGRMMRAIDAIGDGEPVTSHAAPFRLASRI